MSSTAILVAGHAIVRDLSNYQDDKAWHLLDFQRGEPPKYVEHIRRAVTEAAADPQSILIFSGGATRRDAGPRSESLSYWLLAEHLQWFGHPEVAQRSYLEEFARDSFENLLFGICRYREVRGQDPEHVTLVSWAFKQQRFENLHRQAIGWPRERFRYIGPNDPEDLSQAQRAEEKARAQYLADPYSLGPEFQAKKSERNPFRRQHGYRTSCPEWFSVDKPWHMF
ncbi:hypothetical protein [Bryobacter aggregatus]|uniref:hypothetical protein n=1 Tax=Bryobacter aggregatus TaxID=360054 RepID=UPI0004E17A7B|nr:hypothetical protein [Bryobacter aggregatus]